MGSGKHWEGNTSSNNHHVCVFFTIMECKVGGFYIFWYPIFFQAHLVTELLSSSSAKNHAKCDTWLKSLHIFNFDILFKMFK